MDRREFINSATGSLLAATSRPLSAGSYFIDGAIPLVEGQSFIISGSGFGTKPTAGPLVFDDFEHGILGSRIISPKIGAPARARDDEQLASPIYDAERKFGGTRCWKQTWSHKISKCSNSYLENLTLNSRYASYRINSKHPISLTHAQTVLEANVWHRMESSSFVPALQFFTHEQTESTTWIDEIYIDNTLRRVEIGNHCNWFSCSKRSPQPAAWWGDTQIGIALNRGDQLSGVAAYGFVVESDGTVNALVGLI
jgi:hypothetical protein